MSNDQPPAHMLASIRDVSTQSLSESEERTAWLVHCAVTELLTEHGKKPPADPLRSVLWAATQWLGDRIEERREEPK